MLAAARTPPRLLTLIVVSGVSILPISMFLPSLPSIAADLRADFTLVNLSIAGYAASSAVLQLILGPLSDRYGRRPVLLASLAVFVLASIGCGLATDIRVFLGFRFLQGAVIAGYAVSLAVIRDTSRPEEAAGVIGYVTTAWAVAPLLGPTLGGILEQVFGWRASFWAFAGLGLATLALCWVDLGETNRRPSATIRSQFRAFPKLLRSRQYWGYALCMAFAVGAFYSYLGGAPLAARSAFGMSPAALGLAMGSTTAGFILGSFLCGRYARRFALTTTVIAGRLVACAGLAAGLVLWFAGVVHPAALFGPCVFLGIGNGLSIPSGSAGAMSVNPALAGSAAGLTGALMAAGGGLVSAAAGMILTEGDAIPILLAVLLACAAAGLAAALYVRRVDRRAGPPTG
ncbi:multidrug effflux MFS transporter [Thalassobaculum sp.]|uniref:multidrug effflux MFS transporter n=1 Tax=Thalassobaculum sp. TaxID=2022740 RepID=UPI0032EFF56E